MTDLAQQDFVRWRRAIRRQVRLLAKKRQLQPGILLLWLGRDPRKPGDIVTPGQEAEDSLDVRIHVRDAIERAGAKFAALGRVDPETGAVGLVVAGRERVELFSAVLEGERSVSAWEDGGSDDGASALLLNALRGARRKAEIMDRDEAQARIDAAAVERERIQP